MRLRAWPPHSHGVGTPPSGAWEPQGELLSRGPAGGRLLVVGVSPPPEATGANGDRPLGWSPEYQSYLSDQMSGGAVGAGQEGAGRALTGR